MGTGAPSYFWRKGLFAVAVQGRLHPNWPLEQQTYARLDFPAQHLDKRTRHRHGVLSVCVPERLNSYFVRPYPVKALHVPQSSQLGALTSQPTQQYFLY